MNLWNSWVVPAYAGVILIVLLIPYISHSGSRIRGGDPILDFALDWGIPWFPHTRG